MKTDRGDDKNFEDMDAGTVDGGPSGDPEERAETVPLQKTNKDARRNDGKKRGREMGRGEGRYPKFGSLHRSTGELSGQMEVHPGYIKQLLGNSLYAL